MASKELQFMKGVNVLHAFYTENVRMLAHAYELDEEEASRLLARFDFKNVSRSILHPPKVDVIGDIMKGMETPDSDFDGVSDAMLDLDDDALAEGFGLDDADADDTKTADDENDDDSGSDKKS